MWRRSEESKHLCFIPELTRNASEILPCEYTCCGLLVDNFYHVQIASFYSQFGKFDHEWV